RRPERAGPHAATPDRPTRTPPPEPDTQTPGTHPRPAARAADLDVLPPPRTRRPARRHPGPTDPDATTRT
ncbi:hypothetical protein ACIRP7_12615, partial [Streptomyces sp. NPDC102270]